MTKCTCDDRHMCPPCTKAWDARVTEQIQACAGLCGSAVEWLHHMSENKRLQLIAAIERFEKAKLL